MDTNSFWALSGPKSMKRLAEEVHEDMVWESISCPIDRGHLRAGKRLTDLSVALPEEPIGSFVWTWASDCLIQDNVLDSFRSNCIRGFEVKPCKAKFKRDVERRPARLWELVVTGWGGVATPESGIELVEHCNGCNHMVYSTFTAPERLIDRAQWDGSDLFMVWPLPKYIFITDRLAQIIRDAKWQDVRIEAVSDLECTGGRLSPGRLSYWMPDERARQLGCPLGIY